MALYEGGAEPHPYAADAGVLASGRRGSTEGDDDVLDFSDDEVLLDWEQYAGMRRNRLCAGLHAALPWLPSMPPSWWYRYSRRQRKLLTTLCAFASCFIVTAAVLTALYWKFSADTPEAPAAPQLPVPPPIPPPPPLPTTLQQNDTALPQQRAPYCQWSGFRLPKVFVPKAYELELDLSALDAAPEQAVAVHGRVLIEFHADVAFRCLPLHAALGSMVITNVMAGEITGSVSRSPAFDTSSIAIIEFGKELPAGTRHVELTFYYPLVSSLSGLYMSTFTDSGGAIQVMAVTQFEAASAREAFPCFDEPALKATFQVTVIAPSSMQVLNNMPSTSTTPVGNGGEANSLRHSFGVSPVMSSYLVALVVAPGLQSVSRQVAPPPYASADPVRRVSVWGVPGREAYLLPALNFAVAALEKFEALFGIEYAISKMDLVAIPDFAAGAMENWGLITFRETDLLVNEEEDSAASIQRVALVVAHEIAHQWTGNLVTSAFWNDLWLNEGFATYFEYVGASAALPDVNVWESFFPDVTASALLHDAHLGSTIPLSSSAIDVWSVEQIESLFNAAAYDKGGSVLRMLRAYMSRHSSEEAEGGLGKDPFIAAVSSYLRNRQYTAVDSADFIGDLEAYLEASHDGLAGEVVGMLRKWVYEKSVPRLKVYMAGDAGDEVGVRQELLTEPSSNCSDSAGAGDVSAPWHVPVQFATKQSPKRWYMLKTCRAPEYIHSMEGPDDFVKLNLGQLGLYSVSYDPPLWQRLIAAAGRMGPDGMPVVPNSDLAGLLRDSYFQASHGLTTISVFLDLVDTLSLRPLELAPWLVAYDILPKMQQLIGSPRTAVLEGGCANSFEAYIGNKMIGDFLTPSITQILEYHEEGSALSMSPVDGIAESDYSSRILRQLLLSLSGKFGNRVLQIQAQDILQLSTGDGAVSGIPGDIRSLVFRMVASSSLEGWEMVRGLYLKEGNSATQREQALHALASTTDTQLVQRTLEFALSAHVRSQDRVSFIRSLASHGNNVEAVWSFVRSRWADIGAVFSAPQEKSRQMGRLLGVAGGFSDQSALSELQEFWSATAEADVVEKYYLISVEEKIKENLKWVQTNSVAVCEWLASQQ